MNKESLFLVVAAMGLTPVALAYGLVPEVTVPLLYKVDVETVNITHILRAIMGLYLAMIVFWLLGAAKPALRFAALCSIVVFMGGLAVGRAASLLLDGMPEPLLFTYMVLEIGFALAGYRLAMRNYRS